MEDYRSSREWQALNRIWKSIPADRREEVKADFKLVCDYIKEAGEKARSTENKEEDKKAPVSIGEAGNYLKNLDIKERKYAVGMINRGFDICSYIIGLANKGMAADDIFDAYIAEFDASEDDEELIKSIISACITNIRA